MRKLLLTAGLLAVIGLLLYSFSDRPAPTPPAPTDLAYAAQIRRARQQKDAAFRESPDSPLPAGQRVAFGGLRYFKPAAAYRVGARLTRAAVPAPLPLALTRGAADAYVSWGTAEFALGGRPQRLALLQKQGVGAGQELFLPFTDPTNGQQTYAGGRYLDLPMPSPEATEITIDFNTAFNPFCAYNHEYSCPKPPADNRLSVSVPAGEQAYQP